MTFVRQFIRDNGCSVVFDPFCFSVKDYLTHRIILKYHSTGNLCPIKKQYPIPQAFLVGQNTWTNDLDIREVKFCSLLYLVIVLLVMKRSLLLFVMLVNLANM